MIEIDHLVMSAEDLDTGARAAASATGRDMRPGGRHAMFGTHNRLLGLGDAYFEVIAIDPQALPPKRARWFALDHFSGKPRLTNWMVRTDDLDRTLAGLDVDLGTPTQMTRGDVTWRLPLRDDGTLPFDGMFPNVLEWQVPDHPARRLPDDGIRLKRLDVTHPRAEALASALLQLFQDQRIHVHQGPAPAMRATLDVAGKERILQ